MSRSDPHAPWDIAIVAADGLFPGAADAEALWSLISAGDDAARETPGRRWAPGREGMLHSEGAPDKAWSAVACLLEQQPELPPALAHLEEGLDRLDPSYRLALSVGARVWSQAQTHSLDPKRCPVILANIALPSQTSADLCLGVHGALLKEWAIGSSPEAGSDLGTDPENLGAFAGPAHMLSQALGLQGAAYVLDAACASSLYALHLACQELRSGAADAVLTGGMSRPDALYTQVGFSQLTALSRQGRCAPFDQSADGLLVGEGAAFFVLKRHADALRDGDAIHGIIRGIGLSNDVAGSLLSPSSTGQVRAMRTAYARAGWTTDAPDLIECHGTGTARGDRVEVESLMELRPADASPCVIGSVKSNIGHLLTGAGAAGLMKVLLALKHETLPPTAHFQQGLDVIDGARLRVLSQPEPWPVPSSGEPRRAALSGFGFGGINAHVLIEEARCGPKEAEGEQPWTDLAVTGLGARVGGLRDRHDFRQAVLLGHSALADRPSERWGDAESSQWLQHQPMARRPHTGAWLPSLDLPVGRFKIPPMEAAQVLPQQLLALEAAKQATEDPGAGWQDAPPEGRLQTGVVVGLELDPAAADEHLRWMLPTWVERWDAELGLGLSGAERDAWCDELLSSLGGPLVAQRVTGALGGIVASRIARELKLGGPSFVIGAGGNSGLRALQVAQRLIAAGDCEEMLVVGVDLGGELRSCLARGAQRPWSEGREVHVLDTRAQGPLPGEGAVALLVKSPDRAAREGARCYARLESFGCGGGEAMALEHCLEGDDSGLASLGYWELGADGSPAGDRELLKSLPEAEGASGTGVALGSAKAVLGDLGAAAGLAAAAKACLALHHRVLPPLCTYSEPIHPLPPCYHVPVEALPWLQEHDGSSRRAAVSQSLPTEALCALFTEADTSMVPLALPEAEGLFVLSGVGEVFEAQREALTRLLKDAAPGDSMDALAQRWFDASKGPAAPQSAFIARDRADGLEQLGSLQAGRGEKAQPMAWVFPGSGSHYLGMGRQLGLDFPGTAARLEAAGQRGPSAAQAALFFPHRRQWPSGWEQDQRQRIRASAIGMIYGQVSYGVAMAGVLSDCGLKPDAVIGYSLGETAGFLATGAWSDQSAMMAEAESGELFSRWLGGDFEAMAKRWKLDAPDWMVALVPRPADSLRPALGDHCRLLIINGAEECILGGHRPALEGLLRQLDCRGAVELSGVITVHCELLEPKAEEYLRLHHRATTVPEGIRFYSGNWGRAYDLTAQSAAESIQANALHGIDYPALIEQAYADGLRVFVEPGPGNSCTRMIKKILGDRPHTCVSLGAQGQRPFTAVIHGLLDLIHAGYSADLSCVYGVRDAQGGEAKQAAAIPLDLVSLPVRNKVPARPSPRAPANDDLIGGKPAAVEPVHQQPVATVTAQPAGAPAPSMSDWDATARAHAAFLQASQENTALQLALIARLQGQPAELPQITGLQPEHQPVPELAIPPAPQPLHDYEACLQLARGSVAKVFGPAFAEVDTYPVRVRLPDEPLLLCHRIMDIEGEALSMGSGRIVTEHDVLPDAWYLDGGRSPVSITVEAGQADLVLSGWLGIDHQVKGGHAYRLLDATVTFHRDLPKAGETMRYDIHIDRFIRQGDTWLFFFHYDGFIGEERLISMRDGCAGFFSPAQLAEGRGLVKEVGEAPLQRRLDAKGQPAAPFRPLVPFDQPMALSSGQLDALRSGDAEAAFGATFKGREIAPGLRLPDDRMRLIHRVTELDPTGGRYGLGRVVAECDVEPDAWYLTCHFVDDQVMPGTLMYEGCLHSLRVLLLRMGWIGTADGRDDELHTAPILDIPSALVCRGQVLADTGSFAYELDLKEIGYDPEAYCLADAVMRVGDHKIVAFDNVSLRIPGLTEAAAKKGVGTMEAPLGLPPARPELTSVSGKPVYYGPQQIEAYCVGRPSEGFGDRYLPFDEQRRIARLPGQPFCFVDRVTELNDPPWILKPSGWIECEYDLPDAPWYVAANRQQDLPFSVILEAALQPCGWLAAYLGSALRSDQDLHFRNLGGTAQLLRPITAANQCITTRVRMTKVSEASGMIIQDFDLELYADGELAYQGTTNFGFFPSASLAAQVGVRGAAERAWVQNEGEAFPLESLGPPSPEAYEGEVLNEAGLLLPSTPYLMLDQISCFAPDGGPEGLGYIAGTRRVDPSEWFFKAHFYQDPVVPGSLGLESFLQLLKVFAQRRWPQHVDSHRFGAIALGRDHEWIYRGQVIPENEEVLVEAVITAVEEATDGTLRLQADGFLRCDGKVIYEMKHFCLELEPLLH